LGEEATGFQPARTIWPVARVLLLPLLALAFGPQACELPGELRPVAEVPATRLQLPEPELELPLIADARWVLARVRLGERELLAAYDTGLSVRALIDEALCEELGLPLQRGRWSIDGGGGSGYRRGTTLPPVQWGDFKGEEMRALRADLSFLKTASGEAVQLVLGMPLFGRRTVQLDLAAQVVRVYSDAPLPPVGRNHVLPLRGRDGVPYCALTVGKHSMRLLIDSGFDGSLALPDSLREQLPLRGEAQRTGSLRTVLGEGSAIHTGRLDIDLKFADFRFPAPAVQFLEGYRHAVLGRRALDALVLTLDLENGRVHFGLPGGTAAADKAGILSGLPFPLGVFDSTDAR
jgi:predicted aspartyl protease